jgi:hypothetical protein
VAAPYPKQPSLRGGKTELRARPDDYGVQSKPLDELGPVDYVVVEFPAGASSFTGEMAKELLALVDAGTIRVIDVLILEKGEDGSIEATELSDIEDGAASRTRSIGESVCRRAGTRWRHFADCDRRSSTWSSGPPRRDLSDSSG